MSKYQDIAEIKNSTEFQEFVKSEWHRDINSLRDYELTAMFYKFKQHTGDIDEQDEKVLEEAAKTATPKELDDLTEAHFPDKKYDELSAEDKAFVSMENHSAKDLGLTIDDIKAYLDITSQNNDISAAAPAFANDEEVYDAFHELADKHRYTPNNQQDFDEFISQKDTYLADKTPEQKAAVEEQLSRFLNNQDQDKMYYGNELYTVDDSFRKMYETAAAPKEQVNEKTPLGIVVAPLDDKEKQPPVNETQEKEEPELEEARLRSFNSDQNDTLLDMVKVEALRDMKVISDDEWNKVSKQPEELIQARIELLNDKLPKLSDEQLAEYESRVTDKMVSNDELFNLVPPAALAKAYTGLDKQIAEEKDDTKKQDLTAKKEKIGTRMEQLTTMLANKEHTFDDMYFADKTNIADVYEGYVQMYDALDKDWRDDKNNKTLAQQMRQGEKMLGEQFDEYKALYNIKDVKESDSEKLQKRYEELNKQLQGVEIDAETAKLVSNFKFLDDKGNVEPQFMDKDGKQSDVYSDGAKVIAGSKLDTSIRLAKQNVLLENIGTDTKFKAEDLQKEVSEQLPQTLYALHVVDQVQKGAAEHPKQFTDKKFLNQFIAELANPDKPMAISHKAFEAGVDNAVNATAGYADTLAQTVGRDKPVVMSVFKPLQDLDKRADARTDNKTNKKTARIEMLKRTVKGAASAFLVSGAITTIGTMGANKVAGMAIGTGLAVTMTAMQIYKWRKQQKKEGKPAGFKAMLKNRKLVMTVATTAMGAAALGFAATGNPGVASALGIGALAVGTTNGVISNYGDSRKAGLGKVESAGWAAVQAIANVAGATAGRVTANMAIDAYNHAHPGNDLFQHKEQEVTNRHETVYDDGVKERAKVTVGKWYAGHEDVLQQRVDEINQYNQAHGTHIDPYRYLMAAHDAGAQAPDNMTLHNQGAPDVASHGNHMVLGEGWSQETGVSQHEVSNLANSVTSDGHVNLSPESVKAFQEIDAHINRYNQVGYVNGAPYQNDGVLDSNASQNDAGRFVQDAKGDRYTTYADGDSPYKQINIKTTVTHTVDNQRVDGVGMFGVLGNALGAKKLRKRAGALLDRIFSKKKQPAAKDKQSEDKKPVKINIENKQPVNNEEKIEELKNKKQALQQEPVTQQKTDVKTEQKTGQKPLNIQQAVQKKAQEKQGR